MVHTPRGEIGNCHSRPLASVMLRMAIREAWNGRTLPRNSTCKGERVTTGTRRRLEVRGRRSEKAKAGTGDCGRGKRSTWRGLKLTSDLCFINLRVTSHSGNCG